MRLGIQIGQFGAPGGSFFDPSSMNLTGWFRTDFSGAPWVGVASSGSSGSKSLVHSATDPTAGPTINGKTPANYTSNATLTDSTAITSYVSTSASGIAGLINATSAASPSGNTYDDPAIFRDTNADYGVTYTTDGVRLFAYDGSYKEVHASVSTGSWHAFFAWHDGTHLNLQIDSGSPVTPVSCNTLAILTGSIVSGQGYGGVYIDMSVAELITSQSAWSGTDISNLLDYFNGRYGLSL